MVQATAALPRGRCRMKAAMVGGQEAEEDRVEAAVQAQLDGLRAQDAAASAALAVRLTPPLPPPSASFA